MQRHKGNLQGKAKKNTVEALDGDAFAVTSATSGETYQVTRSRFTKSGFTCQCRWSRYHPAEPCTHVLSVKEFEAQQAGRTLSVWEEEEAAKRQHRPSETVGRGLWVTSRATA